jgi:hypothetical protein
VPLKLSQKSFSQGLLSSIIGCAAGGAFDFLTKNNALKENHDYNDVISQIPVLIIVVYF